MKTKNILLVIAAAALSSAILAQADAGEPDEPACGEPTMATAERTVNDLPLEEWMVTPFETLQEEELILEPWMAEPFKCELPEQSKRIVVEDWMLT